MKDFMKMVGSDIFVLSFPGLTGAAWATGHIPWWIVVPAFVLGFVFLMLRDKLLLRLFEEHQNSTL